MGRGYLAGLSSQDACIYGQLRCSFGYDRILEERRILLSLQETDLERRGERLTVEQAHGLPSYGGQDLSTGLNELCACVARVKDERTAEAMGLSRLVMGILDALVNLGMASEWAAAGLGKFQG
jgi:hypothetical protein